jgi:hypothetical protein
MTLSLVKTEAGKINSETIGGVGHIFRYEVSMALIAGPGRRWVIDTSNKKTQRGQKGTPLHWSPGRAHAVIL